MDATVDLQQMTVPDKLRLMEELWRDISRNEKDIISPAWHGEVLKKRLSEVEAGKGKFLTIPELKKRLKRDA